MKIIDLSVPIVSDLPVDPDFQRARIRYLDHRDNRQQMLDLVEGATVEDLPEGNAWALELMEVCTHSGTHMDAPWHYYPTTDNGERAWTIDEVPLEWCIAPGVKIDMSDKPDGYKITKTDIIEYFEKLNYTLIPGSIALLHTSAQAKWGSEEYLRAGAGMSAEATEWLIDQGIRVMGTDGWSWDVPLCYESAEFRKTGDAGILWEAHRVGRKKAYCHIEKLANLDKLPLDGYTVICLPVKIEAASAGWCRAVAVFD